jgi:hypothetical protein
LESTFLAICEYQLYVSEELYDEYYDAIISHTAANDAAKETNVTNHNNLPPIIEEV